jgi:hypothetical protein
MAHGPAAVGFLKLALSALGKPAVHLHRHPDQPGRAYPGQRRPGRIRQLEVNMRKVVLVVIPGALAIFGAFARWRADRRVPIIGEEYTRVIPLIRVANASMP